MQPTENPQRGNWWQRAGTMQRVVVVVVVLALCGCVGLASSLASQGTNSGASVLNTNQGGTGGQTTQQATKAPTSTPKPKKWTTIAHYSGSSNTQTDSMNIPDGAHVVWSYTASDQANLCVIELYTGDNPFPESMVDEANGAMSDHGTYTVHGGGTSYFKVSADSVSWSISVQVYK